MAHVTPEPKAKPKDDKWSCPTGYTIPHWINVPESVTVEDLSGEQWLETFFDKNPSLRCVLIDFFAYSCTNCVRTISGIKELHEKFGANGFAVVALHRPEFDFERDPDNLGAFLQKSGVKYLVGMDNDDIAWNAWKVEMWPTHFLVEKDPKATDGTKIRKVYNAGEPCVFVGDNKINHLVLTQKIGQMVGVGVADEIPEPPPHPLDVELFLGKQHQFKNIQGETSCGEGACAVQKMATGPVTLPPEAQPHATLSTIYGAGWCRFCRAAKMLLTQLDGEDSFRFVDVDTFGGASGVFQALGVERSTIPLVYVEGKMLGGFDDLVSHRRYHLFPFRSVFRDLSDRPGDGVEAYEANVQDIIEQTRSLTVNYSRNGHTAKVQLGHGWSVQDERAVARVDEAEFEVSFAIDPAAGPADRITLYVVGGPPVDGDRAQGQCVKAEGTISTINPDRHFVGLYGSPASVKLRAALGFCLYVVYVTTEAPEA